tara:strand:- start:603 stop:1028 length:426 start_codon:yes stop_codon:yes gene_type:complete
MMADLPIGFWSGWIVVLTCASLATLAWVVLRVYFSPPDVKTGDDDAHEPVWDGDLREGSSAPPLWWFWMLFSLVYLMLFPGLGSFEDLLNWSQGQRLVSSYEKNEASFDTRRAEIANLSLAEVHADPVLIATVDRIFRREC